MQVELFENRKNLLLSLNEETVKMILSGEKKIEFRKVYPNCSTRAFVYVKGDREVSLALDLKAPAKDLEEIRKVGGHGSLDFIEGRKKAKNALIIEKIWKVDNPLSLEGLRSFGTTAPQCYVYLDARFGLLSRLSKNLSEIKINKDNF
ncbi:MAG: hypothetical protein OIF36_03795 [Alphaproteobacteria bacterium]|nr:hypothetical protein [Alphaproteobacteria bacterium]